MSAYQDGKEYDVIFAGGGTVACVTAGRLAEADPSLSILIIEGGKNNLNNPLISVPALFIRNLAPDAQSMLYYKGNKSSHTADREVVVPSGGILGGGSSVNFMMYTRAHSCDFDSWKMKGWDYKSLLPYLKKLETYHTVDGKVNKGVHGFSGPVHISDGGYNPQGVEKDVLAAGEAIGESEIADLNDFTSVGGFAHWPRYVSPEGKRQDAAHCYIHPLLQSGKYPNLHLLTETTVNRVQFDSSKRATAVECKPSTAFQPVTPLSNGDIHFTVKAKKLVVVSSGALGTPLVLERSGIGSKPFLEKLNIPVISDLASVGENYQDHNLVAATYKTNLELEETLDHILDGRENIAQAIEDRKPTLGWNGLDVAGKFRPNEAEIAAMGPEFGKLWDEGWADVPERPLILLAVVNLLVGDHSLLPPPLFQKQYVSMCCYNGYPFSRGSIHITSPSAYSPPSFDPGFLSHPCDMPVLVWIYKKQRELYRRTNAYQGELALAHPPFSPESDARIRDGPLVEGGFKSLEERKAVKDIAYTADDDKVLEQWIRERVGTTWHSLGTCKMAPREKGGVVDDRLNVYGVTGLKLADLSICPENVGANTNNTALMLGEKAADILIEDLGIGGRKGDVSEVPPLVNGLRLSKGDI